ncbi:MAG: hypothetical protein DWQ47_04755 [Acidobacteria bacterium]|nr:MAG: hypothetical protein DWQ32_08305 [Acidobacteriota bacterium]REK01696.1 MAG: hypothetical protein DWQ38_04740 [Acidobacteriota bacterium]REK14652.1 MAG: hypothetical protein DWQ43_13995 [Acidobacteriota bacterium]REK45367.1 MAG: hypothetical protein DWQ47_04755 [Acidobacteriota bacterium]
MRNSKRLPESIRQVITRFDDESECVRLVASLRWPDGIPVCPRCESTKSSFVSTRNFWKCKGCKKQFSVKLGTVFSGSPIGLNKWLVAIWLVANRTAGVSSYELHRSIGVTQKTAWFMLHRIRLAMEVGGTGLVDVETDDSDIGSVANDELETKRILEIEDCGKDSTAALIAALKNRGQLLAELTKMAKF